jgi:hypothetical protein
MNDTPALLEGPNGDLTDQSCAHLCHYYAAGDKDTEQWLEAALAYENTIELGWKMGEPMSIITAARTTDRGLWKNATFKWEDRMKYFDEVAQIKRHMCI